MGRRATVIINGKDANNKKPVVHTFKVYESQNKVPYEGNGMYLTITKDGESWKYLDVRFHRGYEFKSTVIESIEDAFKGKLIDTVIDFKEDESSESLN